jgi:hypothetical protein
MNPFVTNLSQTDANLGGYAPPEGAYTMVIKAVEFGQNQNGSHHMKVSFTATEGEHTGSGLFSRFNFPTGDAKKDSIKLILLTMLAKAVGIPEAAMAALNWQEAGPALVGRNLVVYVEDQGTWTTQDGSERRSYEGIPVPVENAAKALSGAWTPRGGRKPTIQSTAAPTPVVMAAPVAVAPAVYAAPVAPAPVAAAPATGFNGLFDGMN